MRPARPLSLPRAGRWLSICICRALVGHLLLQMRRTKRKKAAGKRGSGSRHTIAGMHRSIRKLLCSLLAALVVTAAAPAVAGMSRATAPRQERVIRKRAIHMAIRATATTRQLSAARLFHVPPAAWLLRVRHHGSPYYYHGGSWYRPYGPRMWSSRRRLASASACCRLTTPRSGLAARLTTTPTTLTTRTGPSDANTW